ncbi:MULTISPECIES: lysozyme inhibitor LprI family protein [unclassified Achromobacter]|uniref:lysozyme inhibitor LprI family protein n=1 Tax=unclassified Achromobacter TaxID=2626865 RepID=UPI001303966B|nr:MULTISPECIES: lysozyme inhibitor LprI family protein [unclassified Achromobacter]
MVHHPSSLRPVWLLVGSATLAALIAATAIAQTPPKGPAGLVVTGPGPVILDPLAECRNAIGDKPRTALARCLSDAQHTADKQMRQVYTDVEKDLRGIDSAATPNAVQTLKEAQKAFLKFRDAECKRQGAAVMGGSGAGDIEAACVVRLTRWRTASLPES